MGDVLVRLEFMIFAFPLMLCFSPCVVAVLLRKGISFFLVKLLLGALLVFYFYIVVIHIMYAYKYLSLQIHQRNMYLFMCTFSDRIFEYAFSQVCNQVIWLQVNKKDQSTWCFILSIIYNFASINVFIYLDAVHLLMHVLRKHANVFLKVLYFSWER